MAKVQQKIELRKKSRKKFISARISSALFGVNPKKSYQNTQNCSATLWSDPNGTLHANYCKNRWCSTCNSIRTAILINQYAPEIKSMQDPYFVTLTAPTVPIERLKAEIELYQKTFRSIIHMNKHRGKFKGLRKLECTIRPGELYHPHFHCVIDGRVNAQTLLYEWLKRMPGADRKAQDIRKADERSTIELFKYFTKLFKRKKDGTYDKVDYDRLERIMSTIAGKRIFQPFGGLQKPVKWIETDIVDTDTPAQADKIYEWVGTDWVDRDTGELLTGYTPSPGLVEILTR